MRCNIVGFSGSGVGGRLSGLLRLKIQRGRIGAVEMLQDDPIAAGSKIFTMDGFSGLSR